MKTQTKIQTKKSTAVSVVSIEGHPVPTSSPSNVLGGLLSFKGDIVKTQNRSQKIKNNIKRLREEAELFLLHISEIEKHHNNRGYHSIVFQDKYNRAVENGTQGKQCDGEENVPIDGTDISIEYLKAWKRLEGELKKAFAKITI